MTVFFFFWGGVSTMQTEDRLKANMGSSLRNLSLRNKLKGLNYQSIKKTIKEKRKEKGNTH